MPEKAHSLGSVSQSNSKVRDVKQGIGEAKYSIGRAECGTGKVMKCVAIVMLSKVGLRQSRVWCGRAKVQFS